MPRKKDPAGEGGAKVWIRPWTRALALFFAQHQSGNSTYRQRQGAGSALRQPQDHVAAALAVPPARRTTSRPSGSSTRVGMAWDGGAPASLAIG